VDDSGLIETTWGDDSGLIDLQTLIQRTKESITICNHPKEKQTLSQRATPAPKPTNSYLYKNKFSTVLQMEPEY